MASNEQQNDYALNLADSLRMILAVGAVVGLLGFLSLAGSVSALRGGSRIQALGLALPVLAYVALMVTAVRRSDAIALLLSAALGVFPIVAAPLLLLVLGVMGGGQSSSAAKVLLSPVPGGIVLTCAVVAALFTSSSKPTALGIVIIGIMVGGLFWKSVFDTYNTGAIRHVSKSRGTGAPPKLSAEEKRLWYHIVACNASYKAEHHGRPPGLLEELGPTGQKCLAADEISGSSASLRLQYTVEPNSPDQYSFNALRADGTKLDPNTSGLRIPPETSLENLHRDAECSQTAYPHTAALIAGKGESGSCHVPVSWRRTSPTSFVTEHDLYVYTYFVGPERDEFYVDMRPAQYAETGVYSYHCDAEGVVYATDENRAANDKDPIVYR
jgi:hypothetical protein